MLTATAFLLLRIAIAWLFLMPVPNFISKWKSTVGMVKSLFPKFTVFFTIMMIFSMIVGSISILFGVYAQVGAALLCVQCFLGVFVHFRMANDAKNLRLKSSENNDSQNVLENAKTLAMIGNQTSAQKNIVLAAIMFFIVLIGSGPFSITGNLF